MHDADQHGALLLSPVPVGECPCVKPERKLKIKSARNGADPLHL